MSGRTGLRRAKVLLALTTEGQSVYRIAQATGLREAAVEGVLDSLSRVNLADLTETGWKRGSSPEREHQEADAWALLAAVEA